MRVEKEIAESHNTRHELIQIVDAAAGYLASRDTDPDSQARARWKLWAGPNGEPLISLRLDDQDYSTARTFTPNQLVPADIRELRLLSVWNEVLGKRSWREFDRVNELIRHYQEG